jgi:signal recognition particle GTPase
MRVPRVRFTVRRLMIAVAIVAGLLGTTRAYQMLGLTLYHRKQAVLFGLAESDALREYAAHQMRVAEAKRQVGATARDEESKHIALAENARKRAAYFTAMRRKYESVATRPWESVEPDPPSQSRN